MAFLDNIGASCFNAFTTDLSSDYLSSLVSVWYKIPLNVVYNAGNMWVDIINYRYYTPATVPSGDWAFFTLYLVGDFLMRFVYNQTSLS
jgi:hypothetical protein